MEGLELPEWQPLQKRGQAFLTVRDFENLCLTPKRHPSHLAFSLCCDPFLWNSAFKTLVFIHLKFA